jgi:nucleotide-binding universal stress UspA family protein
MLRTILHANDGSESAFKALALAIDLAATHKAQLHMICVEEISDFPETIEDVKQEKSAADRRFRKILDRAKEESAKHGVRLHTHVVTGHAVRAIVEFVAERGFDLLVVGATGHSILYRAMIGSRADRLVHLAPCPVLVVK